MRAVQEIVRSADLDRLREVVGGIVGQPCWRVHFSYGGELCLHAGERLPYAHPALADKQRGAWILGTRGTAWRVESPDATRATSADEPDQAKARLAPLETASLTAVAIGGDDLSLTVSFDNGWKLCLTPTPEIEGRDLLLWELFTPERMLLTFGPGKVWSYTRADQPAKA